jgi:hypothetical protein
MADAEKATTSTCPHCPKPAEKPAPKDRQPEEPMDCPCLERQSPTPTVAERYQPDFVLFTSLAVPALVFDFRGLAGEPPCRLDTSPLLHLLHCQWLC